MTSPGPIFDAEELIITAIRNALAPVAGTYKGRPKVYWQLPEQGAERPLLIIQFQTPIKSDGIIGNLGATVDAMIKTQADSAKAGRDLLALAAPMMVTLGGNGYSITATYRNSPPLPMTPSGVYQSGHVFHIHITRS